MGNYKGPSRATCPTVGTKHNPAVSMPTRAGFDEAMSQCLVVSKGVVQACSEAVECHALVLWFETEFSSRFCKEHAVVLSTSPHSPQTHWAQTVVMLRHAVVLQTAGASKPPAPGVACSLRGRISFARSDAHRCLDIAVECQGFALDNSIVGAAQAQLYSVTTS
jgi:protein arginine N-methyltransferase 3